MILEWKKMMMVYKLHLVEILWEKSYLKALIEAKLYHCSPAKILVLNTGICIYIFLSNCLCLKL